jgi:hypothetical protein
MKGIRWTNVVLVPLALGALLSTASAQGKGGGGGSGKEKGAKAEKSHSEHAAAPKQEKSNNADKAVASKSKSRGSQAVADKPNRGARGKELRETRGNPAARAIAVREVGGSVGPKDFRAFSASKKHGQRLAGLVVARANSGGVSEHDFVIVPVGKRTQVKNKSGVLLLDLDDDRDIGKWRVVGERDLDKKGAPSFCRSGAGHPVFGRQWCIDKGFGLGNDGTTRWGRVIQPDVVFLRTVDTPTLERAVLADVLGDIVLNRLAAQAITLGLVEPLAGRWLGEPTGPRVLLLTSGDRPVAEIVDVNRDNRAEMVVVALRPR